MSGLFPDIVSYVAVVVLGLVPAHWCVRLFPGLVLAHWWVELCPEFSGYRVLRVPMLVPLY